jgi:hypothetical protein
LFPYNSDGDDEADSSEPEPVGGERCNELKENGEIAAFLNVDCEFVVAEEEEVEEEEAAEEEAAAAAGAEGGEEETVVVLS